MWCVISESTAGDLVKISEGGCVERGGDVCIHAVGQSHSEYVPGHGSDRDEADDLVRSGGSSAEVGQSLMELSAHVVSETLGERVILEKVVCDHLGNDEVDSILQSGQEGVYDIEGFDGDLH